MTSMRALFRRDDDFDGEFDGVHTGALLFSFFGLLVMASCISLALMYIRRRRQAQLQQVMLPIHARRGHQRSVTITTAPNFQNGDKIYVYDDKMNLIGGSNGRPSSPVPEIRITFPDEEDHVSGQTRSGRVVVVRITDQGNVGLEPLQQPDQLPAYQKEDSGKFSSLDLERIGGLRENDRPAPRYS